MKAGCISARPSRSAIRRSIISCSASRSLLKGRSWAIAVREFARGQGRSRLVGRRSRESKDPAAFIVLFEDSAALAGLVVAAIGVWASHAYGDPRIDGVASIVIGLILAAVAALLAREAKGLLIGERADPGADRARSARCSRPSRGSPRSTMSARSTPRPTRCSWRSAPISDDLTMGEAEEPDRGDRAPGAEGGGAGTDVDLYPPRKARWMRFVEPQSD